MKSNTGHSYTIGVKESPARSSGYYSPAGSISSNHSYTIGGNKSSTKQPYSYSSGHSYTIRGTNNSPNLKQPNEYSPSDNRSIDSKSLRRKTKLKPRPTTIYIESEEASVHDAFEEIKNSQSFTKPISSIYINTEETASISGAYEETESKATAKYLETIGKLTNKIEKLEMSQSKEGSSEMDELRKEVESLKLTNQNLRHQLKAEKDAKQDVSSKADQLKIADLEKVHVAEKKEMQEEISHLTKDLEKTKENLNNVLKTLNSAMSDHKLMEESNKKRKDDLLNSLAEMKEMEEASQKLKNTMKNTTDEHLQIIELLTKQKVNMDIINEEQNRILQCFSKHVSFIQEEVDDYDEMFTAFDKQRSALESSMQVLGSVAFI